MTFYKSFGITFYVVIARRQLVSSRNEDNYIKHIIDKGALVYSGHRNTMMRARMHVYMNALFSYHWAFRIKIFIDISQMHGFLENCEYCD